MEFEKPNVDEALEPVIKKAYEYANKLEGDVKIEILSTLDFLMEEIRLRQEYVNTVLEVVNDELDEEQTRNIVMLAYTIMINKTIEETPAMQHMKPSSFKFNFWEGEI